MLAHVQIGTYSSGWSEMSAVDYARLRAVLPDLPDNKNSYYGNTLLADHDAMLLIAELGLTVSFDKEAGSRTLQAMIAKTNGGRADEKAVYQIAIPNLGLLEIGYVTVLTDGCTDDLQRMLNDGWRLLAVCPPVSQRRPDYVLGRQRSAE